MAISERSWPASGPERAYWPRNQHFWLIFLRAHFSLVFFMLENISPHQMIANFMLNPTVPFLTRFLEILARFFHVKVPRASFCVKSLFLSVVMRVLPPYPTFFHTFYEGLSGFEAVEVSHLHNNLIMQTIFDIDVDQK